MKVRLIFDDAAAFASISAEIEVTPAIDGGVGPVRLGAPARLSGGRMAVAHELNDVDVDWIVAYADDPRMAVETEI